MSDPDPTAAYTAAIDNIKETAKWLTAALGAVLTVMLGGIQLNSLGFSDPLGVSQAVWLALGLMVAVIVMCLYLAVEVLVSEGVTLPELKAAPKFEKTRDFINQQWSFLSTTPQDHFGRLIKNYEDLATQREQAALSAADEKLFQAYATHLKVAVYLAKWRDVLVRFRNLRVALLLLVPAVSVSAVIIAGAATPDAEGGKALESPAGATLPANDENRAVLEAAGWPKACVQRAFYSVLIYKLYSPGIAEAATYPTDECSQVRVLVMDRTKILKTL